MDKAVHPGEQEDIDRIRKEIEIGAAQIERG
jgi:hypothetical protein